MQKSLGGTVHSTLLFVRNDLIFTPRCHKKLQYGTGLRIAGINGTNNGPQTW
jgi:hypothetical protein